MNHIVQISMMMKSVRTELTLFFPMFHFDLPESIRKPKFSKFSGGSKGNIDKKRIKELQELTITILLKPQQVWGGVVVKNVLLGSNLFVISDKEHWILALKTLQRCSQICLMYVVSSCL